MKVLLNTTPLGNAHAMRGIGMYTRLLQQALSQEPAVELVAKDPDIIHYPFFDLFFDTLPIKKKTRTVVTIHDVIPLLFPERYTVGIKGKARLLKQKVALKSASAIITDSHASKWDIVDQLGVPEDRVHVVYLAANPAMRPVTPRHVFSVIEKYQLPASYILYVGDINFNKNLPQLIKALKFLPEMTKLVLLGKNFFPQEIPEWQDIERQIALSDVVDRVVFVTTVGADDTDDLAAIYSGAVCYVQPSLVEGFGLPILEALQCETPVVSAANSSLVEVGGDQVIYCGTDAEALAQAITDVQSWSQRRRQQWVAQGAEWAVHFTWHRTAEETTDVYRAVLNSRSS